MPQRIFIEWTQPFLSAVARQLAQGAENSTEPLDLGGLLVLAPGARAGRLLLHAVAEVARSLGRPLIPPAIVTPGGFAEALCRGRFALATPQELQLAWMAAIRDAGKEILGAVLPHPVEGNMDAAGRSIAETLQELDAELQGEGVTYETALQHVNDLAGPREAERWRAIAHLRQGFADRLQSASLVDPSTALRELRAGAPPTEIKGFVLVGLTELPPSHVALLRWLEELGGMVTSFVQAPESLAHMFDEFGCLKADAWHDVRLDIDGVDIVVADRPRDQAQAVLVSIARTGGALAAEDVAIGLGDEALGSAIKRAARRAGLDVHLAAGESLERTGPVILLASLADWLADPTFSRLAAIARHADLEPVLIESCRSRSTRAADHLIALDESFAERLFQRLDDGGPFAGIDDGDPVRILVGVVEELTRPLHGPPRPLGDWMNPIIQVLARAYERVDLERGGERARRLAESCRAIVEICAETARLPRQLQHECGSVEALRHVVSQCAASMRPEPVRAGQIEALGWLELRFDPARTVIITGLNEGVVPSQRASDGLLPDSLRSRLGLKTNRWRQARDLYVFDATRRSRQRTVVITGRRDSPGQPLVPSRFLLSCEAGLLPRRVLRLTSGPKEHSPEQLLGWPAAGRTSRFVAPVAPAGILELPRLRVTQFRRYLECPFRFWLECVRGLEEARDDADELDPLRFGSLAHDILRDFGRDESIRDSTDSSAIARDLEARLRSGVRDRFGSRPMAAVRVQAARLRQRLDSFATLQAALRREGWRIHECEFPLPESSSLEIEGGNPMPVTGTIDRIDLHDDRGVMLIDYKTSEGGDGPRATHGPTRKGEWIDLQLPLYHHFYCRSIARGVDPSRVRLCYIALPKKPRDVALMDAEWSADELAAAVERARVVVAAIRAGHFEPSAVPAARDRFANICQTTAFASAADAEADCNSES